MCAINGFTFPDRILIQKMNEQTVHRGPDGSGVYVDEHVSLGHNRLSILDLSDLASQPMRSASGRYVIIFNGEIYNYHELKRELQGYPFKTTGDTEVILAAYEKWGRECVRKFQGIFAFALTDTHTGDLFLARDHIGVKPLYYMHTNAGLIFSSEIKAILEHPVPRKLHLDAFNQYIRLLYVPGPLTMFRDIYMLPPAHYAVYHEGRLSLTEYWQPVRGTYLDVPQKDLEEKVRETVRRSVRDQLLSDRPLGLYLSGGIDSSVVLESMSQVRGGNIDTFSVGFDMLSPAETEQFNQDFYLARRTASAYGTNHHEVLVSAHEVPELFGRATYHMDQPISNATAIPMMKLAAEAKRSVDVVLGGDGGDELFGGYERYRLSLYADLYQHLPSALQHLGKKFSPGKKLSIPASLPRYLFFMAQKEQTISKFVQPFYMREGATAARFASYFSSNPYATFEELCMDVDRRTWLVDFSLMLTDKMSMSSAIEARVPLLHLPLVELASGIPRSKKVSLFATKKILKDAFRNTLPTFLFNQPKRGWFSPGAKWLRYPGMKHLVSELLSPNYYAETKDIFSWEALAHLQEEHLAVRGYHLHPLWSVMVFQYWAKRYGVTL